MKHAFTTVPTLEQFCQVGGRASRTVSTCYRSIENADTMRPPEAAGISAPLLGCARASGAAASLVTPLRGQRVSPLQLQDCIENPQPSRFAVSVALGLKIQGTLHCVAARVRALLLD